MLDIIKYPAKLIDKVISKSGHGYTLVRSSVKKLNINFIKSKEKLTTPLLEEDDFYLEDDSYDTNGLPTLETDAYTFTADDGMFTLFFFGEYSFNTISFARLAEIMNADEAMQENGILFEVNQNSLTIKATKEDVDINGMSWVYTDDIYVSESLDTPAERLNNKSYSKVKFISLTEEDGELFDDPVLTNPLPGEPEIIPTPVVNPVRKQLVTGSFTIYQEPDIYFESVQFSTDSNPVAIRQVSLDTLKSELLRHFGDKLNIETILNGKAIVIKQSTSEHVNIKNLVITPSYDSQLTVNESDEGIPIVYPYPGVDYIDLYLTVDDDTVAEKILGGEDDVEEDFTTLVSDAGKHTQYAIEVTNTNGLVKRFFFNDDTTNLVDLDGFHRHINSTEDVSIVYDFDESVLKVTRYPNSKETRERTIIVEILKIVTTYLGDQTIFRTSRLLEEIELDWSEDQKIDTTFSPSSEGIYKIIIHGAPSDEQSESQGSQTSGTTDTSEDSTDSTEVTNSNDEQ